MTADPTGPEPRTDAAAGEVSGDIAAAIATIKYSRQTHVEWASYHRRNPSYEPGAIGGAEYHEQAVREYDNVLVVLREVTR